MTTATSAAALQATRDILDAIHLHRGDEIPVFETILEHACRLSASPFAFICLVDEASQTIGGVVNKGGSPTFAERSRKVREPLDCTLTIAQSIREARTIHVDDLAIGDDDPGKDHPVRAATLAEGVRSILFVPLVKGVTGIGCIAVYRREVRPFEAATISLIETFASQAVIAIENVRQFREVQERLKRETATKNILRVISQSRDDETPVFDAILEDAVRLCGADSAGFLITNEDRTENVLVRQYGDRLKASATTAPSWALDAGHPHTDAVTGGCVVHVDDMRLSQLYIAEDPTVRNLVDKVGVRTALSIPLMQNGVAIGALSMHRLDEVKPFLAEDIALLESFAAQAVIAIENVRQFREVQTRLERESATREILHVISQSRDDEQPVFEAILDNAARLCDAPQAVLLMVNDAQDELVIRATFGVTDEMIASLPMTALRIDVEDSYSARAVRECEVVHLADIRDDDAYRNRSPHRVVSADVAGIRTSLAVPLILNGRALGVLMLNRLEVQAFDPDQIALVESFAAQAVIAIENVRQFREVQERLERERASAEILAIISQSRDDELPVFEAILKQAERLCSAQASGLQLLNESGTHLRNMAGTSLEKGVVMAGQEYPLDQDHGMCIAVREGRVVHIEDLKDTDLYQSGDPTRRKLVDQIGARTGLAVPLMRNGAAFGNINLTRSERKSFSDDEIALVETFAAQAVIAIENVRQFREVQERLERERASAEILEVISRSRGDEVPVFDVIVEAVSRLCDAPLAYLCVLNEERSHVTIPALTGARPEFAAALARFNEPVESDWLFAVKSTVDCEVIRFDDLADSDLYRNGNEYRKKMVDEEGMRSVLSIPVEAGGVGYGCIVLYRREVAPFSDEDVNLVRSFAAQAVIAIENVRQFREVQERLEREEATREILSVISQSRDDEAPVFDAILAAAARLCDAPIARLELANEARTHFTIAAAWGSELRALKIGEEISLDLDLFVPRTMREARSFHIPDLADTPEYHDRVPFRVLMVEEEGIRTYLTIPLIRDGVGIGCIVLSRREVKPFADSDIDLVKSFAAQAVIAIENVRQFREVQERLEREEASRDILEVISQSRDDENPVFDVIVQQASRLCDAPFASLILGAADDSHQRLVAHIGGRPEVLEMYRDDPPPMDPEVSITAEAIINNRVVHEPDLTATQVFKTGSRFAKITAGSAGIRTCLWVPLISGGQAIGAMVLYRTVVKPFADSDIQMVETFAAQAVIAIENVRQFREVQERLERERATSEVLGVISRSRDDETPVFDMILDQACEICETPLASIVLGQAGDADQILAATRGGDEEERKRIRAASRPMDPESSLAAKAIIEKRIIHLADMKDTDFYREGFPVVRQMVDEGGVRSVIFVPLIAREEAIGAIIMFRREVRPFSEDHVSVLNDFAAQAVIAIENVRQFKALETLNAELGDRVESQVGEIERMGRLKRFLPSAVADAVVTSGDESMLTSHRAMVATLFCDMRGFTAFCEAAEPEETIEVLQTYHQEMSDLIDEYGGGVDQRAGDGIMVIFNDPIPVDDPAGDAVRLAVAMRDKMHKLCAKWKRLGHRLGFGVGISLGYATVGMVGSAGRFDYTASGTSVNTAARLCDMAADGEVLISPRVWVAVEGDFQAESRGEVEMKGIREPVEVFAVA